MEAILERRSCRKYKSEPLTQEQYAAVMQAFDWAPTARNEQEIRAIVMRDPAMIDALAADFSAFCEAGGGRNYKQFHYGAPVFIFLVGPKDFPFTAIDAGITVENMALAAQSVGVGSVIIGCLRLYFADPASAGWRKKLGIKDDEIFPVGIALGLPDMDMPKPKRKPGKIVEL